MTHDWFSHMEEGQNAPAYMAVGCTSQKVNGVEMPLTADQAARLGCRPNDAIDRTFVADASAPGAFAHGTQRYLKRAPQTFRNTSTAWWDVSQIYGYSETSRVRVKRDPADAARLLLIPLDRRTTAGDRQGYLPLLADSDPKLAKRGNSAAQDDRTPNSKSVAVSRNRSPSKSLTQLLLT